MVSSVSRHPVSYRESVVHWNRRIRFVRMMEPDHQSSRREQRGGRSWAMLWRVRLVIHVSAPVFLGDIERSACITFLTLNKLQKERTPIPEMMAPMIPPFGDHGYLPPGIHPATLEEIETRFGRETEVRRVQAESVRWLVDLARRAGVERLVITDSSPANRTECRRQDRRHSPRSWPFASSCLLRLAGVNNGSLVTEIPEPNDVDCALLVAPNVAFDPGLEEEFENGLPFLQIDLLEAVDFAFLIERIFATDRDMVPKGVVEVLL
jgi:hypothetical protein